MVYKGTTEEQLYLTAIKREKDAFHHLIKEKATLVMDEDGEGRGDDHPALRRSAPAEEEGRGRKGGAAAPSAPSRVIVDMREFRSELPALLHKRGIDIEPLTIEVGDYVLSPRLVVERKSPADLVGSLNSGRLYAQAAAMTRCYQTPALLIEFHQDKPFHLQAALLGRSAGAGSTQEPDNRDTGAKLQLLTLHFPKLRLLWCSSPYATAELFHLLKAREEEPDGEAAQAYKSDGCSANDEEVYSPAIYDLVSKLPGVTSKNIGRVMAGVRDLPELVSLTLEELTSLMGHSANAAQLHAALHTPLTQRDIDADLLSAKAAKTTRKGLPKFTAKK